MQILIVAKNENSNVSANHGSPKFISILCGIMQRSSTPPSSLLLADAEEQNTAFHVQLACRPLDGKIISGLNTFTCVEA